MDVWEASLTAVPHSYVVWLGCIGCLVYWGCVLPVMASHLVLGCRDLSSCGEYCGGRGTRTKGIPGIGRKNEQKDECTVGFAGMFQESVVKPLSFVVALLVPVV